MCRSQSGQEVSGQHNRYHYAEHAKATAVFENMNDRIIVHRAAHGCNP
ncbi:hypothetical protein BVI1335_600057 [Burkholderia vietnamiensis]|nr:hypothetical protein BVI1335_600057 [Burkholderia vietnamiensis]